MNGGGEEFLARSGLAGDQNISVGPGRLAQQAEAGLDGRAFADHTGQVERALGAATAFFVMVFQCPAQGQGYLAHAGRFEQVVPDAAPDGQLRAVRVPFACEDDDLGRVGDGHDLRQDVKAVAVRQADIQKDDVEFPGAGQSESLVQGVCRLAFMGEPGDQAFHGFADFVVVVDDQYACHNRFLMCPKARSGWPLTGRACRKA